MKGDKRSKKDDKRSKQDVSLDDVRDMLWKALDEKDAGAYLQSVYGGYIIYEKDGKYFRLPYSILEGDVRFGERAIEVERIWVEARERNEDVDDGLTVNVRLGAALDPEGASWEVIICEPGFTKHAFPWFLGEDVLREAADEGLFENVDVNLYELPEKGPTHIPEALFDIKSLLARNKVAWIDKVTFVAGEGLKGVLHFLDSFKWIGRNLLDAMTQGAKVYGLSYDCPVVARKESIQGKDALSVRKILSADSVDIVTRPAAGGKFIRAVASRQAHNNNGRSVMDKDEILAMIKEKRPDLLEGKDLETLSDEDIKGLARMAMETPMKTPMKTPAENDPGGGDNGGGEAGNPPETGISKEEFQLYRCSQDLDRALESGKGKDLPEHAKKRMRSAFRSRIFEADELDRAIADEMDYLAKIDESQRGDGDPVPAPRFMGGLRSIEKLQMACDRLFGLSEEDLKWSVQHTRLDNRPFFEDMEMRSVQDYDDYNSVPAYTSIRDMYALLTGDPEVSGRFNRKKLPPDLRAMMDITSSTFSYVLGNTLGRRLVRAYRQMDFKADLLISIKKPVRDFRQQEAVLVGGFPDIEDVDPEAGDYNEIATVTDEESTYTVGQKGNLLTITRKTIINDDISLITRLVDGFGRSFGRTHGKYVWNMWIDNDACSDSTSWHTSGHGNLGSTALSHTTAYTAWTALAKMTEKDSGERIGLIDGSFELNLVGPPDVKNLMKRVAHEEFYYTSNDVSTKIPNPLYEEVDDHVITLLTDTNDWGMMLPPNIIDLVEMGYLNGREEPEFFVADSPQAEQVFVADKIRHKGRHEYAGAPIDFRGTYKAQV